MSATMTLTALRSIDANLPLPTSRQRWYEAIDCVNCNLPSFKERTTIRGRLFSQTFWQAKGIVKEVFKKVLEPRIFTELESRDLTEGLRTSNIPYRVSCYMFGRKKFIADARPSIYLSARDQAFCRKAVQFITSRRWWRDFNETYPDFRWIQLQKDPQVVPLMGTVLEPNDVPRRLTISSNASSLYSSPIVSVSGRSSTTVCSTFGGFIRVGDDIYGMTAKHAYTEVPNLNELAVVEIDECETDYWNTFSFIDDGEDGLPFPSDSDDESAETIFPSDLSAGTGVYLDQVRFAVAQPASTEDLGVITWSSSGHPDDALDWALIKLDDKWLQRPLSFALPPSSSRNSINSVSEPNHAYFFTTDGLVTCRRVGLTKVRLPTARSFVQVTEFEVPYSETRHGLSGTWIFDTSSHLPIGHIIAGVPGSNRVYAADMAAVIADMQLATGLQCKVYSSNIHLLRAESSRDQPDSDMRGHIAEMAHHSDRATTYVRGPLRSQRLDKTLSPLHFDPDPGATQQSDMDVDSESLGWHDAEPDSDWPKTPTRHRRTIAPSSNRSGSSYHEHSVQSVFVSSKDDDKSRREAQQPMHMERRSRISAKSTTQKRVPFAARQTEQISVTNKRIFPCVFQRFGCSAIFANKNEWKRHVSSQHMQLGYYRCDLGFCNPYNGVRVRSTDTADHVHGSSSSEPLRFNDFFRKDLFTQHCRRMHGPQQAASKAQPSSQVHKRTASAAAVTRKEEYAFEAQLDQIRRRCWLVRRKCPARSCCGFCFLLFDSSSDKYQESAAIRDSAGNPKSSEEMAWDDRMELLGRHYERGDVRASDEEIDDDLCDWGFENGVLERTEDGSFRLVSLNTCETFSQNNSTASRQQAYSQHSASHNALSLGGHRTNRTSDGDDDYLDGGSMMSWPMEIDESDNMTIATTTDTDPAATDDGNIRTIIGFPDSMGKIAHRVVANVRIETYSATGITVEQWVRTVSKLAPEFDDLSNTGSSPY